jgi:ribosomal-protein-alanine N-acetyltransferase
VAFLRSTRPEDDFEVIRGHAVLLRQPMAGDYSEWASWAPDDLSRGMYRRRLRAYAKDIRDDTSYPYFIFDASFGTLVGGMTLSNVRRGSAQTASLGYWMGAPYAGRGYMREAVSTLMPVVFGTLRLHRIEAATMVNNAASIRVLEVCGFEREGLARSYLKINGRWEDHLLYARVAGAPLPAVPRQGGGT